MAKRSTNSKCPNPSVMSEEDYKYAEANLHGLIPLGVANATTGAKIPVDSGTGTHFGSRTKEESGE